MKVDISENIQLFLVFHDGIIYNWIIHEKLFSFIINIHLQLHFSVDYFVGPSGKYFSFGTGIWNQSLCCNLFKKGSRKTNIACGFLTQWKWDLAPILGFNSASFHDKWCHSWEDLGILEAKYLQPLWRQNVSPSIVIQSIGSSIYNW